MSRDRKSTHSGGRNHRLLFGYGLQHQERGPVGESDLLLAAKKTGETKTSQSQVYPEPTVGALIVNEEGKILLAKSHKWFDKYTLPGGHIEVGETMVEAVKREVKEEVGLDVEVAEMLLMQEAIFAPEFYKKKHFIFIDFLCRSDDQQVRLDQEELQDYIWVYPGAAYNLKLDSFTARTLDKYLEGSREDYGNFIGRPRTWKPVIRNSGSELCSVPGTCT